MSHPVKTSEIVQCLPLVASMLSKYYGVRVTIGGDTASTDGRIINIPTLPLDDENIVMDVRGYIDHESAHIRFSDKTILSTVDSPIVKNICNILEDWRVEQNMGSIFPGCQKNLYQLNMKYFLNLQPTNDSQSPILRSILLTVISWLVPPISGPRDRYIMVAEQNFPGLWPKIETVLAKFRIDGDSTRAALEYAQELVKIIEEYAQTVSQQQNDSSQKDDSTKQQQDARPLETEESEVSISGAQKNDPSHSQDRALPPSQAASEAGTITPSAPTPSDGQSSTSSLSKEEGDAGTAESAFSAEQAESITESLKSILHASEDDLPDDLGTLLKKNLEGASFGCNPNKELSVAQEGKKDSYILTNDEIQYVKKATCALKARMLGLLQSATFQRSRISFRGNLNSHRLYRMDFDSKIFLKKEKRQSIDTAIHILLDASNSMHTRINLACLACYATSKAMENINGISVGVSVFPVSNDIGIFPLVRHGQRVHNRFKVNTSGFTPLAQSLWWVMQTMIPLKHSRKLILILTDGEPDNPQPTYFALEKAKLFGFEVYGIGIKSREIRKYLPSTSCDIWAMEDLAPAMFRILQKALLHK